MADSVTIGSATGKIVSTEELTSINGVTVAAEHAQRVISAMRTADSTVVDGVGLAQRLDPTNDAITSYPFGHSSTNIITNATTTVKTGAGVLAAIKINNPSAITVASLTLTAYDNTAASGTKIGTWIVPIDTAAKPFGLTYAAAFTTGLTIVTSGPTVTADITVEYR